MPKPPAQPTFRVRPAANGRFLLIGPGVSGGWGVHAYTRVGRWCGSVGSYPDRAGAVAKRRRLMAEYARRAAGKRPK